MDTNGMTVGYSIFEGYSRTPSGWAEYLSNITMKSKLTPEQSTNSVAKQLASK